MPASRGATTSSALAATTGSSFLIHSTLVARSRLSRSASTISARSIHWTRHSFPAGLAPRISQTQPTYLRCSLVHRARLAETFNATSSTSGFLRNQINLQNYRYWNVGPYIGDTWRARPNLTLNFGLRWEYVSVPKEENGLLALPIGGLDVLLTNAQVDAASGGGRPLYKNDWNNFAPSFSFAWDPFKDGKTSVRGGYGISYVIDNNITTIDNAASRGFTRTITINDVDGNSQQRRTTDTSTSLQLCRSGFAMSSRMKIRHPHCSPSIQTCARLMCSNGTLASSVRFSATRSQRFDTLGTAA